MRKITLRSVFFFALLTTFIGFGQGTGVLEDGTNSRTGIQNNFGVENTQMSGMLDVLVVGAPGNPDWLLDVELKLDNTGLVAADTYNSSGGTPTLAELQAYEAVFLFTDAGAADPVALGDALGMYIDGGGAVVDATFTPNVPITGGFTAYELYSASGQSNGANLGLGTISDPSHPILNNVTSFDGGTQSFHNTGGTLAAGATILAEYSTAAPFIIIQENVGPNNTRRTFLNFYPPSSDARDDFWSVASDGALIIANALRWTADFVNGPPVLVLGSPGNPDWLLDVETQLEGTGRVAVDTYNSGAGTPTLAELQAYEAVLLFTDAGAADPVALGDALGMYIDGGGAVVDATFTPNVPITGGFTAYELYSAAGQSNGANLGLGTINDASHPILNNVTNFDGGTASFHNTGGTLAAGATILAEYSTGAPFIIFNENLGPENARRTFLNFYPPSSDARDDFWNVASDGATILVNALLWTANINDGPDVLVLGSPGNPDWLLDVEAKLEETNFFNADTYLASGGTPTLAELQEYDAVFLFTDAGAADPVALGDVLAAYIEAGDPVVDATFTPNVPITGGFTAYELYSASGQSNGTNLGIGTIYEPTDPILTGVTNFDGGTASFHNSGGTVAAGAVVIADYTDATPLLIRASDVGPLNTRRVFINFYPPSIDVRDDFWDVASDGALIMRNALLWAIDGVVLDVEENTQLALDVVVYPNPAQNELNISNTSGISIEKTQIIDISGRIVRTIERNDDVNSVINISNLSTGIYLLRLETENSSSVVRFIKN